jgi:hypothetical protein
MRFLLYFLLFPICCSVRAQAKVRSITLKRDIAWLYYSFPFIQSSSKAISNKINYYLQKEILDNPKIETHPKKIFENSRFIDNDSIHQGSYTFIDYSIETNNSKILSLEFQFETMGAYPESFPDYYNFNLQTGEVINTKELLTVSGIEQVKKMLILERKKLIDTAILELKGSRASEFQEDSSFFYERFAECNEEADEQNILIKENSILFFKGYCFPHVARSFDIDLNIELSFAALRQYFTPYAQSLLSTKKKPAKK